MVKAKLGTNLSNFSSVQVDIFKTQNTFPGTKALEPDGRKRRLSLDIDNRSILQDLYTREQSSFLTRLIWSSCDHMRTK
ncbi:hypothetical protein XENTR_v10014864 [Xenopus tropicalis]|nr:hypothetical protein XENTR_v10014864 [Xenopus tropicalis]